MAMSSEQTTAKVGRHLEFLGYTSGLQDDGWMFAAHPTRPDLCFRAVPFGVRVVTLYDLGRLSELRRADWLEFANRCNNVSILVRFALGTREDGGHFLRAVAVYHGEYAKAGFGAFIDAWHEDLALLRHAPEATGAADEAGEDADEAQAGAEVSH